HCTGDWVVVMDCDLQDAPEEIPRLYAKAQEGFDIVLAKRTRRKDSPRKKLSSVLFYRLFNYLTGMNYDASVGNFRIMSSRVVENCRRMRESLRFLPGMVEWLGFPTASIEVEHGSRYAGESAYTFRKLVRLASDVIVAYSDKPLRLSIKLGFGIAAMSFVAGMAFLIYAAFFNVPIMGWSSLIISLYFLGGIIIANLGVIGIYLGKTFDETKKRPLYIIHHTTFEHDS
ncbi:MAG: glycosyltransferase, partial [Mariprofundus sp.]